MRRFDLYVHQFGQVAQNLNTHAILDPRRSVIILLTQPCYTFDFSVISFVNSRAPFVKARSPVFYPHLVKDRPGNFGHFHHILENHSKGFKEIFKNVSNI